MAMGRYHGTMLGQKLDARSAIIDALTANV